MVTITGRPCGIRGGRGFGRSGDARPAPRFLALVVPELPASLTEGTRMIEVENLSKRYGEKLAVDGLDFVVQPGIVTGFLGPNGAGKSTTMRMIAGLDH